MISLNDEFLEEHGFGALPAEARAKLLHSMYHELEKRAGEALSQGMSDEMLDEFGHFADQVEAPTLAWLDANVPDWRTPSAPFGGVEAHDDVYDYAALAWIKKHRPNYPEIVADQLQDIVLELLESRDAVLASLKGQPALGGK